MIENHGPDCQCQVIWEGAMTRLRSVAHPCQELQVVRHCVEEKKSSCAVALFTEIASCHDPCWRNLELWRHLFSGWRWRLE